LQDLTNQENSATNRAFDSTKRYLYKSEIRKIKISKTISIAQIVSLVDNAVEIVISDKDDYNPYFKELVLFMSLLNEFTDFDISAGYDIVYDLMCYSNLNSVLKKHIDKKVYNIIVDSYDELIYYNRDKMINKSRLDDFAEYLIKTVDKLTEKIDLNEMKDAFNNISKLNVNQDDIVRQLVELSNTGKKINS
jgi:hypothetical protein